MNAATPAASVPSRTQPQRPVLGRILGAVLAALLLLLGLGLAALCLARFAALGGSTQNAQLLWLGTLAAAELVAGQLVFGAEYAAWDGFYRALTLALLASFCLGLSAWAWPRRRRHVPVPLVPAAEYAEPVSEPAEPELYSFRYGPEEPQTGGGSVH